jgi:hypothetical protein
VSTQDPTQALRDECHRQSENCGYTATTFIIWLRCLRWARTCCLVAPVIFGAVATWKMLAQTSPIWAAVFTLLAPAIPPAYRASKTDGEIQECANLAGEFTNLRDRFRQAGMISSQKQFAEFEADTKPLLDRLEIARQRPDTAGMMLQTRTSQAQGRSLSPRSR